MGFLSDINPVKAVRKGFESVTGISDARKGLQAANAAQQTAVQQAISGLQAGGGQAAQTLQSGQQGALGALGGAFGQATQSIGGGRQASLDALTGGNQAAISTLSPIAGLFDPQSFGQNFTQQGFGQQLAGFADPQGAFSGIFDQRQQSATNALGAAGLARSGRAAEEAARIDLETALGLSDTLFQRQSQNPALGAIQNIANLQSGLGGQVAGVETGFGQNLANLQTGFGQGQAGLQTGLSSDLANLQLGQATNIANLGIGGAASEAQTLQAIGGLRGQVVRPLIEAGIGAGAAALAGGG